MIFVTVGTHEQPFQRLFDEVGRLAASSGESFFCQIGSAEVRLGYEWTRLATPAVMAERTAAADVVVAHGGPATIIEALRHGKPVVLVPRRARYGEHVDDHQLAFCRRIATQWGLPLVEDIADLESAISQALAGDSAVLASRASGIASARRVIQGELQLSSARLSGSRLGREQASRPARAKTILRRRHRGRD